MQFDICSRSNAALGVIRRLSTLTVGFRALPKFISCQPLQYQQLREFYASHSRGGWALATDLSSSSFAQTWAWPTEMTTFVGSESARRSCSRTTTGTQCSNFKDNHGHSFYSTRSGVGTILLMGYFLRADLGDDCELEMDRQRTPDGHHGSRTPTPRHWPQLDGRVVYVLFCHDRFTMGNLPKLRSDNLSNQYLARSPFLHVIERGGNVIRTALVPGPDRVGGNGSRFIALLVACGFKRSEVGLRGLAGHLMRQSLVSLEVAAK